MKLHNTRAVAAVGRYLMVFAAGCFIVVVLTHVCEAYHQFPSMGWGLERSAGHYLDLSAAVLGFTLFPVGYLLRRSERNGISQGPQLMAVTARNVKRE
jgi:hypothetical protein